jgi:ubiquitin-like-conjugating enzyme ATG3
VLTPEEFVKAGDHLVHSCRTWSWETGDEASIKSYLPRDKQYLHIRRVPSYRRVSSLQGAEIKEVAIQGDESAGGDWCSTAMVEKKTAIGLGDGVMVDISDFLEGGGAEAEAEAASSSSAAVTETAPAAPVAAPAADDEYLDMEDSSLALDDSTVVAGASAAAGAGADGGSIVYPRRYDVSITYDKYWQTPRIWLFGYDEHSNPLPPVSIFDDIISDYAKKTVTIEAHPHLSTPHASIHPCQHAAAMLRIVEALSECGQPPGVEQYMFIFLKFMQSVMPTIEYDYTFDVQVRAK